MSQLKIELDTEDTKVCRAVADMLLELGGVKPLEFNVESIKPHGFETSESDPECTEGNPLTEVDLNETFTSEVDSAGTLWDARIHSSSRGFVANGTWKKRKNLPDGVYEQVMEELMGNADTSATESNEPTVMPQGAPITEATPPPPPPPPPSPSEAVVVTEGYTPPATFQELMQRITVTRTPIQKLQAWCTKEGLGSFALLGQHPDRVAEAAIAIGV